MKKCGIYRIVNLRSRRGYVGQATDLEKRKRVHLSLLRSHRHFNRWLQRAWDKHPEPRFKFIVLEECLPDQLLELEQKYIDAGLGEYNLSREVRAVGKRVWTAEQKQAASARLRGNTLLLGHRHSEETKKRIGMLAKGRPLSERGRAKARERMILRNQTNPPRLGKQCSEEHKRRLSEARRNHDRLEREECKSGSSGNVSHDQAPSGH